MALLLSSGSVKLESNLKQDSIRFDKGKPCGKGFIAANLQCGVGSGATSEHSEDLNPQRRKKQTGQKLAISAAVAGAATIGLPVASYLALRQNYRAGFVKSAEMAKAQAVELGRQNYPVSSYEKDMVKEIGITLPEDHKLVPDVLYGHTMVMRETMTQKYGAKQSQIPIAKQITIVANGFDGKNNANGGSAVANDLAGKDFSDHHIVPVSNEGFAGEPSDGGIIVSPKDALKAQLTSVLRTGRNPVAVRMAATAYAFHQKHPDLPINLVGYSGAGMATHEAAEILKELKIPVKVANFGSPYWGLTEKVGPSVTFNSPGDYATEKAVVRDEVNVNNVKDHSSYLKNKTVRSKLKEFFDGKPIAGEVKRAMTPEEKAKAEKRKKAMERAARMQKARAARQQSEKAAAPTALKV
jgi:hypothetical protein